MLAGVPRFELITALALFAVVLSAFLLGDDLAWMVLRSETLDVFGVVFSGVAAIVAFALLRLRRDVASTKRKQAALQAELERRERFWASAAHDVKSHVAAIGLRAQLIKNRLGDSTKDEQQPIARGLEEIRSTASRISSIIVELQDIARLNLGAPLNLDLRACDLLAMVRSAIDEARVSTNNRRRITLQSAASELVGEWDPLRLCRVIANLLDNALKYSPESAEVLISVEEVEQGGRRWARVAVTDHGLGIPAHELSDIFEPFHRASNVPGRIPGTGLGLAGTREIVEQHGGAVTASSEQGRGSTFTAYLPLPEPEDTISEAGA
jgi:signal transduction histidine kinase